MPNTHEIADRFVDMLRGRRAPKHTIDDTDYGMFLLRAIRAWEARCIENPEMLTTNVMLAQRFNEIVDVVIAANAERYATDPRRGASMLECARILGMVNAKGEVKKSTISYHRARGVAIMAERIDRAGAVRFSEAVRERQALEESRDHAAVYLADYRARHAAAS